MSALSIKPRWGSILPTQPARPRNRRRSRKSRSTSRCRCRAPATRRRLNCRRCRPGRDRGGSHLRQLRATWTCRCPLHGRASRRPMTRLRRSSRQRPTKMPDRGRRRLYRGVRAGRRVGGRCFPDLAGGNHSGGEGRRLDDAELCRVAAHGASPSASREPIRHRRSAPGVKTTAKAGRAVRKDVKPEAKPKVIAAQPQAARWALDSSYVASKSATTEGAVVCQQPGACGAERSLYGWFPARHAGCRCRPQSLQRQGRHLHDGREVQHQLIGNAAPLMRRCVRLPARDQLEASAAASRASFSISAQSPDFTASSGATQEPPTQITLGSDR